MHQTDLYKRIRTEIDKIDLIDTHEHLEYPDELVGRSIDWLFVHYINGDVVSAGMPAEDIQEVLGRTNNHHWTPMEKWQRLKPYYQRAWNTAYNECIRIALRDLYCIDDLRDDTMELLSEKMSSVDRNSWTREVFDRAHIDIAMQTSQEHDPVYKRRRYPDLFLYDMAEQFSGLGYIDALSKDSGIDVYDLEDYLRVIDWYFDNFADEAAGFKICRAYDRTLFFDDVPASDASRVFSQARAFNSSPSGSEMRALDDFIIHYCIRKATEYDLPVRLHTGLQAGNSNDITNSRAALLINLFMKYPKTKFDIYHISWPYAEELTAICKSFPNVYINFCWAWIVNPPASRRHLSDMLETVPINKIHGFGGDFTAVEGTYGHSVMARREIARVLAEKVEEGRFPEEYAVEAARRMLRENAMENFRVREKRKLFTERASKGAIGRH